MRKHKFLILALVVLLGFTPLFATDYYVKNGGNDAASGLDDDNAWETIAKVNGESFSPADIIYFNKGDEWREMLTVPDTGDSNDQIAFGAYGTGADPIINGADLVATWDEYTGPEDYSARGTCEAYYKFASSGDLGADEQNQVDCTNNGAVQSGTIPSGTYANPSAAHSADFELDDTDYMDASHAVASEIDDLTAGTMAFWVNLETSGDIAPAFMGNLYNNGWGIRWEEDANNIFSYWNENGTYHRDANAQVTTTATWYFMAMTYDGTTIKTYFGTEEGQVAQLGSGTALSSITTSTTGTFELGNDWPDGRFDGRITDVALFSEALTLSDLQDIQQYGVEGSPAPADVWSATLATDPDVIYFDGDRGTESALAALNAVTEWHWAANVLYCYSTTDPDTAYTSPGIETAARDSCITDGGYGTGPIDYITIDGLELLQPQDKGVDITHEDSNNWVIENCTVHHNGADGGGSTQEAIWINGDAHLVDNCTVYESSGNGIGIHNSTGTVVENNTVYDNYHNNIDVKSHDVGIACDGTIVRYNTIYYTAGANSDSGYCIYVVHTDGTTENTEIYYNLIYDDYGGGITVNTSDNGTVIYNNMIFNSAAKNVWVLGTGTATINNNLGMTSADIIVKIENIANKTVDNNCWYQASGNLGYWDDTEHANFALYAADAAGDGAEVSSIGIDPLMTDPASEDFTLNPHSPCIDAGTDVGLTEDYLGIKIRHAPDIGAYENQVNALFHSASITLRVIENIGGLLWP